MQNVTVGMNIQYHITQFTYNIMCFSPCVGVKSIDLESLSLTLTLYRIQICPVNVINND